MRAWPPILSPSQARNWRPSRILPSHSFSTPWLPSYFPSSASEVALSFVLLFIPITLVVHPSFPPYCHIPTSHSLLNVDTTRIPSLPNEQEILHPSTTCFKLLHLRFTTCRFQPHPHPYAHRSLSSFPSISTSWTKLISSHYTLFLQLPLLESLFLSLPCWNLSLFLKAQLFQELFPSPCRQNQPFYISVPQGSFWSVFNRVPIVPYFTIILVHKLKASWYLELSLASSSV